MTGNFFKSIETVLSVLPWSDWLALIWFFVAWVAYDRFAKKRSTRRSTILGTTNRIREMWMLQMSKRDVRVVDGIVVQSLSTAPSFFASTTILIIGGLLALLGTTERASELVQEIPFAARTSLLIFDLKLLLLTGIFVYAFFRFTWSLRQYGFVGLLVGATPLAEEYVEQNLARQPYASRIGMVVALAAETFNDGLRSYYMSFAAMGWFFSPVVFAVATAGVIYVLYQREFHSDVIPYLEAAAKDRESV